MCSLNSEIIPPTADIDTVRAKINDSSLRLIDVRREEDYNQGHIPNAVNLPLASLLSNDSSESVVKLFEDAGIADDTKVIVYDDTFGALASRVAWTLQYVGHKNVALLEVTYSQWKDLGLKTSIEKPNIKPTKHSLNLNPDIMATAEYLEKAKENDNVVLIDNRERLNFLEQHIPGSINIPYRTLATDGKILRTKESMRNLLKNRGIPENAEIITYCGSVGTLSGLAYYALKSLGIPNVKLYVNSFKEWKKLEKPIGKQENASYWDLSAE
jgi:thiosulfate/3-mercaptopyruvate sulfurtransferase